MEDQLNALDAIASDQIVPWLITHQVQPDKKPMVWVCFDDFTPQQKALQEQLARVNGSQEFRAYVAALRAGSKVVVNKELLQKKQQ